MQRVFLVLQTETPFLQKSLAAWIELPAGIVIIPKKLCRLCNVVESDKENTWDIAVFIYHERLHVCMLPWMIQPGTPG